jgi:hypothetical protein
MSEYDGGYEPTHEDHGTDYPHEEHYDGNIGDAIGQPLVDVAQYEGGQYEPGYEPGHEPDVEYKDGGEHGDEYPKEGAEYNEPNYGSDYEGGQEGYAPAEGSEYAGTTHGSGGGTGTGPGTGAGDGSGSGRLNG